MARLTRRAFLVRTGRAGIAAAGVAAFGPSLAWPGSAADERGEQVRVLIGEASHTWGSVSAAGLDGAGWHESPVVRTDFPFTHVGLHWQGSREVALEARSSLDGQGWSAWKPVSVESRPDENPRGEWFAALLGAPRARFAQYRFPQAAWTPERVTLTYLNSVDGPREPLPVGGGPSAIGRSSDGLRPTASGLRLSIPSAHADGGDFRASIVTREQWGADESLRFRADGSEVWPRTYVAPRIVVVHHTATETPVDGDKPDPAADVRAIYAYHTVTIGFGDIGYNALIASDGTVYEGRRGRDVDPFGVFPRDILSFGVVAGHAFDYNYGSVGVALLGNYMLERPTEAILTRLEDILMFEHRRHQIDPRARLDFARSSRLWRYDLPTMPGHRDCNNTECPGDNLYPLLSELRERVAWGVSDGQPLPTAIVERPTPRNFWLGAAGYVWAGAAPFDCVFEGFRKPFGEEVVEHRIGYTELEMPEHIITPQNRVRFDLRQPGQYTLHLRPADRAFADQYTILADRHVVRDNADAEGVERSGTWTRSRNVLQFYGSEYEFAESGSGARFTWRLEVPEDGRYAVQACWAAGTDRAPDAPYTISRDGEVLGTVRADQTKNGGLWVQLGEFDFRAGQTCSVTLSAEAGGEVVIADAVRLVASG